jgi:hypothetical protein
MALDPRISLAVQPPNIQPPDLLKTMLVSAQMRESATLNASRLQQMQEMQAELVRQERQREILREHEASLRGGGGGQPAAFAPSILQQELRPTSSANAPVTGQTEFRPVRQEAEQFGPPAPGTTFPGYGQAYRQEAEPFGPPAPAATAPVSQPAAPLASGVPTGGYLGPQKLGGGQTATALSQTVTDARINQGKPTNIPLIVPGISQQEIQSIAAGKEPSEEAYERSIAHAQSRIARGEQIPSYGTIDEAVSVSKAESEDRGTRLASAATTPSAPAQVTPLPGMRMTPRTTTQLAYKLLSNGASNAIQAVQAVDAAENAEVNRQTARLQQGVTALDYLQRTSIGVNSQATLDAVRADIESKAPGAGQILPPTYEPGAWGQFQQGLKTQEQLHREALLKIQEGQLKVAQGGLGVQQQQAGIHQQQVTTQERAEALKFAVQAAPIVHDQTSLDNFRKNLPERIAALLPQTYTAESWAKTLENLKQAHARAIGEVGAMQPTYYRDANGNLVAMQPTNMGNMRPFNVQGIPGQQAAQPVPQPGVPSTGTVPPAQGAGAQAAPQGPLTPAPPVKTADTGTEIVTIGPGGAEASQRIQKQPGEAAAQAEEGKLVGKEAAERAQKSRDAQRLIREVNAKHDNVYQALKDVQGALNAPGFPANGTLSQLMNFFGESNARELRNKLGLIKANLGLEELTNLKSAGTTLGQVTEAEHRLLQEITAVLDPTQEVGKIRENMGRIWGTLEGGYVRRNEAFASDFPEGAQPREMPGARRMPPGGTVTPPPAASPGLPGRQPQAPPMGTQQQQLQQQTKPVISREQQERVLQGKSPAEQEALKRAWRLKYQLEGE